MDLVVRTLIIAGAIINLCAIACLFGIAYILPLAYPQRHAPDEFSVLFVGALIVISTYFSWFSFQREFPGIALVVMYAWWLVGIWFINRLVFGV